MPTLAFALLTVLAQGSQNTQEAPDEGVAIGLIIGVIVLVIVVAAGIFFVLTRTTRASRGGVEHPDDDKHRGDPPFESVERHS